MWGARPYVYYTFTLLQPKTWRGPGPPGPLGDYIPAKHLRFYFETALFVMLLASSSAKNLVQTYLLRWIPEVFITSGTYHFISKCYGHIFTVLNERKKRIYIMEKTFPRLSTSNWIKSKGFKITGEIITFYSV